jgi:site-specific DNA-methyltransferase (adenine-specific)
METKFITQDSLIEMKKMEPSSIDSIITDPPYGVSIRPEWDSKFPAGEFWVECERVLKPGGHLICFGQPSMMMEMFVEFGKTKLEFRDSIIWTYQGTHTKGFKTKDGFRSKLRNVFNPILVFRKKIEDTEEHNWIKYKTNLLNTNACRIPYKGKHESIIERFARTGELHFQSKKNCITFEKLEKKGWLPNPDGAEPTNVVYFARATTKEKTANGKIENNHATVKPVGLMVWLVRLFTHNPNQIVLDPFSGSGSTGIACAIVDRNFIGIDIDAEFNHMARRRVFYANDIEYQKVPK